MSLLCLCSPAPIAVGAEAKSPACLLPVQEIGKNPQRPTISQSRRLLPPCPIPPQGPQSPRAVGARQLCGWGLGPPHSLRLLIHAACQRAVWLADSRCVGCKYIWSTPGWLRRPPPLLHHTAAQPHCCHQATCAHRTFIWPHPVRPPHVFLPSLVSDSPREEPGVSAAFFPLQLSLKCRAPEVSQHVYQAYETILKN